MDIFQIRAIRRKESVSCNNSIHNCGYSAQIHYLCGRVIITKLFPTFTTQYTEEETKLLNPKIH